MNCVVSSWYCVRGAQSHTVGQVEELFGGCQVRGDGHVALLGFGDFEELAGQWVGMVAGASAVCQVRFGRHGGWWGSVRCGL